MRFLFISLCLTITLQVFCQTTLIDKNKNCKYVLPWNCEECSLTWSGDCQNQLPQGKGNLQVSFNNEVIMEYTGNMEHGDFSGIGHYKDAMNDWDGFFINGYFLGNNLSLFKNLEKVDISNEDPHSLYINDGIENTNLYYYKLVPTNTPKGVLVVIPSGGESVEMVIAQPAIYQEAYNNGFMVVIPSINWGTIDRKPEIEFLDAIFKEIIESYQVNNNNFTFCGFSNGGMVSFAYAIAAVKEGNTLLTPKAIISIDPPLDLVRFYNYCEREIARGFSESGVREARFMSSNYINFFGGSPDEVYEKYVAASTFTYGAAKGGNAQYLTNIPIMLFSDLNTDFLLNQRKRDLYDWNGIDIVAFANQLQLNGNQQVKLIISQNKGVRTDGTLNPHSWSILDYQEVMPWLLELYNE